MKISKHLALGLLIVSLTPVFGQQPPSTFAQRLAAIQTTSLPSGEVTNLTKFNLDFPGGTPKELVAAIEKATGKPLNAIISTEDANLQMPPLKMNDVVVPQLFAALKAASRKTLTISNGGYENSYSTYTGDYGFETGDRPSDASIWYFHADKPVVPPKNPLQKVCQFYSLSPYLDRGFTVDDITTAIQTGWKMAGVTPTPELNYHKETKLLIAFGDADELRTIEQVLNTLPSSNVTLAAAKDYENGWQQTHNQIVELDFKIKELEGEISKLTSTTNSMPTEKSGK
jgi:hypothetical protein